MDSPPNILVVITDQQRAPMHWPDEPGWLEALTPADAELARTGLTFTDAITSSCMCSPSRATLYTGLYPTQHGVTLTLTEGGALPDRRHLPAVVRTFGGVMASGEAPRTTTSRAFVRGVVRRARGGDPPVEPVLRPETPNIARMLRTAGYSFGFKGKWHLSKPLDGEWSAADADHLEDAYGFSAWEPPDAGENVKPANFGGGNAGRSEEGWDEDFTRQAERMLAGAPEPFALVVSLVNPHDVLGYPESYEEGGYTREEFRELSVPLPDTIDEDLTSKPSPHALMKLGQAAYLGPLNGTRAKLDYLSFYAHLHRLVDAKIGRLLSALGDPGDPRSLRSRTIVIRTSDHGEMGLAHGGLRQKMFNAYEETIRVPLMVSNPVLFPEPAVTDAPAALVDLVPTIATLSGGRASGAAGVDLAPVISHHARPNTMFNRPRPRPSVQDGTFFQFEDHKAGTAFENVVPQPNRIRAIRERAWKYAVYMDPSGEVATQYELYDLFNDPDERENLVRHDTGAPVDARFADERDRLHAEVAARAAAIDDPLAIPLARSPDAS